jgi:hypothetical protein
MKKCTKPKSLLFMLALWTAALLPATLLAQTKYEAELATLTGVSVATSHAGYTGSGYVDGFDNSADRITFTVNAPSAGAYPLVIRYSGPYGEKFQTLLVNGTQVSACAVQFPSNANWADKSYGNVTLNAGSNTIAIVSCYGWFQVDYITVGTGGGTNNLTVSPGTLNYTADAGSSNVTVTSNVSWTVTDNQSWISTSPTSGSNNGTVAVSVTANTGAARSGTVTISGGSITRTVSVSQAAGTTTSKYEAESATLTGVTTASEAGASGGAFVTGLDASTDKLVFTVNVATAGSYPLVFRFRNSCGACEKFQFIKINTAAEVYTQFIATATGWTDKNYGNVSLNAGNNTIEIRSSWGWTEFDYITVGSGGGGTNNLTVSPGSLSFGSGAGSNSVSITSNLGWTASDDQSWISVSPGSGSNNGSISVTVTANGGSSTRTGNVTVTGGGITRTVAISQSGVSTTTGMTPGTNFWNIEWEGWQSFFAPGVNWATTTNPWNPTFISELQAARIKCLRFMDWVVVNNSCVVTWNQRIPKTANHYNSGNTIPCFRDNWDPNTNTHTLQWNAYNSYGVAYEWQIDLCNRIGADMWVNIPIAADNNFIDQLANLINTQLNPGLKVYIEYANETWNTGFCTWVWSAQKAQELGLQNVDVGFYCEPWRKYTVYASVRAFQRFQSVFGVNSPRLVKVIAGQVGYHWPGYDFNHMANGDFACLTNSTINPNNISINAWAVAPYMGGQSVTAMRNELPDLFQHVAWAKNSLNGTPYKLLCYEGGSDNYPDNNLSITRDPGQEQLYVDFLTGLSNHVNGHMCQYTFYGGPWGLKNVAGESSTIASKWRGWVSYWNAHPPSVAGGVRTNDILRKEVTADDKTVRIYGSPTRSNMLTMEIQSAKNEDAKIVLFTMAGQRLAELQRPLQQGANIIQLPVNQYAKGTHLLVISKSGERLVKKIVIE